MSYDKIPYYSLADLKGSTDDAIQNFLNSLGFNQIHTLVDTRLAIGYTAFTLSSACFAWDYKFGFDSTKQYTLAAVAIYTILNGILTIWILFKEKGIIYTGIAPNGDTIAIASSVTKNIPVYNLTITIMFSKQETPYKTIKVSRPFTEWFDGTGHFMTCPFQAMIISSVPLVAELNPGQVPSIRQNEEISIEGTSSKVNIEPAATETGSRMTSRKKGGKKQNI